MSSSEQETLQNMWKVFGYESSLGKKFHKMYNLTKPQGLIEYPKVKTRPPKQPKEKAPKRCPQKTTI